MNLSFKDEFNSTFSSPGGGGDKDGKEIKVFLNFVSFILIGKIIKKIPKSEKLN